MHVCTITLLDANPFSVCVGCVLVVWQAGSDEPHPSPSVGGERKARCARVPCVNSGFCVLLCLVMNHKH